MHRTLNVAPVQTEKFMLFPVQRTPGVGTSVDVGMYNLSTAHDEHIQQAISILKGSSPAAGILQLVKSAQDSPLRSLVRHFRNLVHDPARRNRAGRIFHLPACRPLQAFPGYPGRPGNR